VQVTNKSPSLVIKDTQIKTPVMYHHKSTRIVNIKNTCELNMTQLETSYIGTRSENNTTTHLYSITITGVTKHTITLGTKNPYFSKRKDFAFFLQCFISVHTDLYSNVNNGFFSIIDPNW
jgi:hypothetical protein